MNDERIDEYLRGLDGLDAAAEWWPEGAMPSFDEWNARRMAAGLPAGTLDEYLLEVDRDE